MKTEEVLFKDICLSISDGDHLPPPKVEKGIPFITISNITDQNMLDFTNTLFVPSDYYENLDDKRKAVKDDILYSVVGSFGKPVLIKKNKKFAFQRHIAILRPNKDKVNPAFLYYKMSSKAFYKIADTIALGAAQRTITLTALRNLKISLPSIDIQNKIASILSRYDDLIENYQQQIKLLEEAAQRLYKEWFIDLHFPGYENTKITDGVPEGWEFVKVNSFVELLSGYAFKSKTFEDNGKYKIATIKNIKDGYFDGENISYINTIPSKMPAYCVLNEGDILLSLTGSVVGKICLVFGQNYLLNQRIAKLKTKYRSFVYILFRSKSMYVTLNNIANGVAQQNVSPIRIGEIPILLPNSEILNNFEIVTNRLVERILHLYSQITLLTEARDRLLPKLMSGEIEI